MDYLTFVNICWMCVLMVAVFTNFKNGYAKGVADGYEQIMIPALHLMMSKGYLSVKHSDDETEVDPRELGAYLVKEIASNSRRSD